MEKYEKPCMEVVEIKEDLTTKPPCTTETSCPFDGSCMGDISISHS